jgi:hypothetical protein
MAPLRLIRVTLSQSLVPVFLNGNTHSVSSIFLFWSEQRRFLVSRTVVCPHRRYYRQRYSKHFLQRGPHNFVCFYKALSACFNWSTRIFHRINDKLIPFFCRFVILSFSNIDSKIAFPFIDLHIPLITESELASEASHDCWSSVKTLMTSVSVLPCYI